ncbi:lmo0954 family membrane protein [Robertmurraya andreesenii]|uniref:Lia operon protein LiaI n=1 Tax=Anoxybacillus andreesenii TaxID=1325932 RepID=A0ABT9V3L8_9BACL|nr:flagellar basal body rod protein [Robertmurraya andreesenii]MDQ0155536.1 lia operon protein LiaI [Robertmurraya andreesenii]
MKKFGLLLLGGIAAFVLIANLGPLVGLAVSLAILYYVFKQFLKTDSLGLKIGLAILGFFLLMAAASNVPAIIGIVAAYILFVVYKKWNGTKEMAVESDDPFQNFEKQWSELKNY